MEAKAIAPKGRKLMRKLTTLMLGLSLVFGVAGLTYAADEKKDDKKVAPATTTTQKKKHSKKHKKSANKAAAATSTNASPSTPSPSK
jgi:hypothetical protein